MPLVLSHTIRAKYHESTNSSPKDHDTTWFCTKIRLGFHNLQFIFVLSTCDHQPATITYLYEQLTQVKQQTNLFALKDHKILSSIQTILNCP
jgi:hypothetical protein